MEEEAVVAGTPAANEPLPTGQVLNVLKTTSSKCGQELPITRVDRASADTLTAVVSGNEINVYHKNVIAACGNPAASFTAVKAGNNITLNESLYYPNGMFRCECVYDFSAAVDVDGPGVYDIKLISKNGSGNMECTVEVK
jgi:hypothetical protein